MFVKMYEYYIQKDKMEEYLIIQEKASIIYGKYIHFQSMFLNSESDPAKWIEITKYKSEEEYLNSLKFINQHPDIQDLFRDFQALLVTDRAEILEGNYVIKKELGHFTGK